MRMRKGCFYIIGMLILIATPMYFLSFPFPGLLKLRISGVHSTHAANTESNNNIIDFYPCKGDFDEDGDVDGSDLALFASSFGRTDCPTVLACKGDFECDGDVDGSDLALFASRFGSTIWPLIEYKVCGLNFSPYMDGQNPNINPGVSEYQIRCRMKIVQNYTTWIRTYGSTDGLEHAGRIAHEMGLKAAVGAWLSKDLNANESQVQNLISAAKDGYVDIAIIGSEVLLRGDLTEDQLIGYIKRFKNAVPDVPVTSADVYSVLLNHPLVMDNCDMIFVNYLPYWEGIDVDKAVAYLHARHQEVVARANGKEVIISETGWPSDGNQIGAAVPSLENACFYFLNFVSWACENNVRYFYFEAFDEAWKVVNEGPQGAHWGVWDKNGILKPCMKDVFEGKSIEDNWTCREIPGGQGEPGIEFTYIPPYGSDENLKGQVWHVDPDDYKVAVYIYVVNGWWTKPYWDNPLTVINCDGAWMCDIVTGGQDRIATKIIAYLLPSGYNPPSGRGESFLPQELEQNCAAWVLTTRIPE